MATSPAVRSKMEKLALMVASGQSVRGASRRMGLNERTARGYASTQEFKNLVTSHRAAIVSMAVGRFSRLLVKATKKLETLMDKGQTEAIQLSATKAIVEGHLSVQRHAELTDAIRELEAERDEQP